MTDLIEEGMQTSKGSDNLRWINSLCINICLDCNKEKMTNKYTYNKKQL